MVTVGELKEVVSLENPTKTLLPSGGRSEVFDSFCTTRAKVTIKDSFREISNGYDGIVETIVLYLNWRNALTDNFNRDTRVIWNNKTYQVARWESLERRWIKIEAQAVI